MKQDKMKVEEFMRYCLYCDNALAENAHANRRFCYNKYGIVDFCKRKFNDLVTQLRLAGEELPSNKKDAIKKQLPEKETIKPIVEASQGKPLEQLLNVVDVRQKNIEIINKLLGDAERIEIGEKPFFKTGYDKAVYDTTKPFHFDDLLSYNIGPYAIIPYEPSVYLLTYLNKI
ncbi:MAG TPA: hypothetical protein VKG26_08045 [Bacteroidia bacterium]|nr:hypothetical protein [Bacteroidia bacterium]